VDQAAENLYRLNPGGEIGSSAGSLRRCLLQALVRPMAVVMAGEVGQYLPQMLVAQDQHVIQALVRGGVQGLVSLPLGGGDPLGDRRPSRRVRVGPFLRDQATVAGQQGSWGHDPAQPQMTGQPPG